MRASSSRTERGSTTSISAPQPARFRAMSSGVGAARRTRTRPWSSSPSGWQCRPNWSRRIGHEPLLDEHGRPGARAPLLDLADDLLPRGGESEVVRARRRTGRSARPAMIRSTRKVRCPRSVPGQQVPDVVLVDQAPRVDQPFGPLAGGGRRRSAGPCAGGSRRSAAGRPCAGRRRSRSPQPGRVDHRGAGGGLGVGPEGLGQRPQEFAQRRLGLGRNGRGRADEQEQRLAPRWPTGR